MKTIILLARHGETEWNLEHRLQGHKNSPLTNTGRQQAELLRNSLGDHTICAIYTSPLGRAVETATIVAGQFGLDPVARDGIREINLGPWEGKTRAETEASYPEAYQEFWCDQENFCLEGAEDYHHLEKRVVDEIEKLFRENNGKTVLVVSHWIAIKTIVAHYLGLGLNGIDQVEDLPNGQFVTLENSDGVVIL